MKSLDQGTPKLTKLVARLPTFLISGSFCMDVSYERKEIVLMLCQPIGMPLPRSVPTDITDSWMPMAELPYQTLASWLVLLKETQPR
jgi:hypothetical protein